MDVAPIQTDLLNERKRAFWKGFISAAVLVSAILGLTYFYFNYLQVSRLSNVRHTRRSPSTLDVAKISSLLSLPPKSKITVSHFGSVDLLGLDSHGWCMAVIKRTADSPGWNDMLKDWTPYIDPILSYLVRQSAFNVPRLGNRIENYQPQQELHKPTMKYKRRLTVHQGYLNDSHSVRGMSWRSNCEAFFLPSDSESLYICMDGAAFSENSVIDFELSTSTLVMQ